MVRNKAGIARPGLVYYSLIFAAYAVVVMFRRAVLHRDWWASLYWPNLPLAVALFATTTVVLYLIHGHFD